MQTTIHAFKNEIVESEKSRIDLLKWKFIVIGALGSIALGVKPLSSQPISESGSSQSGVFLTFSFASTLIFCLIPLLCVYIDLLCKHLNLRILVVGNFFLKHKIKCGYNSNDKILEFYREYEDFCDALRDRDKVKPFAMEDWAQEISTITCSFLIIILAFFSDISHLKNNFITSSLILIWAVTILPLIWWFTISIFFLIYEKIIEKKVYKKKDYKKFVVPLIFLGILLGLPLLVQSFPNSIIRYSSLSLFSDSRALCIAFFWTIRYININCIK